jgi:glycosyltransferase involved in cell wall biosynthesis
MRYMRNQFDILIEEVNAAPYFSVLFERKARPYLFYHQMETPVWHYQTKPPLSQIGQYILEPSATKLLALSKAPVVTISQSTANDLKRHGFQNDRLHIISEGIEIEPLTALAGAIKYAAPTLLSLGAMRAMKRTIHQIEAFECAKAAMPNLKLKVAGKSDGAYGQQVLQRIAASPYRDDIEYLGKVSIDQKIALMRQSHLLLQTAVHEGWGLTVTEAASQGTPAVVYDVNGLRDSVRHKQTGIVTPTHPRALAEAIVQTLGQQRWYDQLRHNAWEWSKSITFDQSYKDFKKVIGIEA